MSKKETTPQEVEATYLRLAKIYWSQFWRSILWISPVFVIIFAYGVYKEVEADRFEKKWTGFFEFSPSINYALKLFFIYLLNCLLFRLIIGLKYSDFSFSFVPPMDKKTPGFWPALFYVSWAYFWRSGFYMIGRDLAYMTFPHFFEISSVSFNRLIIEVVIYIYLLRFVVNKQYGNVRLSLLKHDKEVTP
ncbi:MAG: hypothetical protein K2Y18_08210 [Alphaproteobacteria bacterium]|jgi:hypothetical protein|nr:hypothetical protein [Alphaproteobacteria bacterium]